MRVAALYDIHGNLPALEAVLSEVDELDVELVLFGGDFVLGPMPTECLARLRGLGERAVFIRGNCEREVLAGSDWEDPWGARTRWVGEQLADERSFLAALPETVALDVDGLGRIRFCHGSPRRDDEILTRASPEERVRDALEDVEEDVVVCGHTHVQFDRRVAGRRLVNAGSVGMPYETSPGAYWALLGREVDLRRTEYDLRLAAERIRATGFPDAEELAREDILTLPDPDEATALFESQAAVERRR